MIAELPNRNAPKIIAVGSRQPHSFRSDDIFFSMSVSPSEFLLRARQRFGQPFYFFQRVVQIETGPAAGGDFEFGVQRHGAVVAGADGYAAAIKHLSDVVGVNAVDREADDARFL